MTNEVLEEDNDAHIHMIEIISQRSKKGVKGTRREDLKALEWEFKKEYPEVGDRLSSHPHHL